MATSDRGHLVPDGDSSAGPANLTDVELSERKTYCILGVPLDLANMNHVVNSIRKAATARERLFVSTLNLNFVVLAQKDAAFRRSLVQSDLCLADGIAVKYLGKLLGAPVSDRVAGSDIINAFWDLPATGLQQPLKVFFFGGTEEAGSRAAETINRQSPEKVVCVGTLCPGFGSIEDMSSDAIINAINNAQADFLIVALGARKGQEWIMHNMVKLEVPVISHLGATINFLAGTVKRAPVAWQNLGLEWLWRIRQEPALFTRYWTDGITLLKLLLARVAPLFIWLTWSKWRWRSDRFSVDVKTVATEQDELVLAGNFISAHVAEAEHAATMGLLESRSLCLDLSAVNWIDTRAMGSLLLLAETARKNGTSLTIKGANANLQRAFRINGLSDLSTD